MWFCGMYLESKRFCCYCFNSPIYYIIKKEQNAVLVYFAITLLGLGLLVSLVLVVFYNLLIRFLFILECSVVIASHTRITRMSQALVYYCDYCKFIVTTGPMRLERFVGIFGEGFVTTESESTHGGFPLQTLSHAGVFALRAIQLLDHFDIMGSRLFVMSSSYMVMVV